MTHKERAHMLVNEAIRTGRLQRPATCSDCGNGHRLPMHGHHEDYSKPLEVIWLCVGCHRRLHAMRGAQRAKERTAPRINVPSRMWKEFKIAAIEKNVSLAEALDQAIRLWIEKQAA